MTISFFYAVVLIRISLYMDNGLATLGTLHKNKKSF